MTDATRMRAVMAGCTHCVACFGAARIAKISDLWPPKNSYDLSHPRAVNYQGVVNLVEVISFDVVLSCAC